MIRPPEMDRLIGRGHATAQELLTPWLEFLNDLALAHDQVDPYFACIGQAAQRLVSQSMGSYTYYTQFSSGTTRWMATDGASGHNMIDTDGIRIW